MAMEPETYDVVVVGGGAAGLTAALVLARARRRVVVVDAGEPRNAPAGHVHGFLSREGMSPAELQATGRDEVTGYGGELIPSGVRAVEPAGPDAQGDIGGGDGGARRAGFQVHLADGRTLPTRAVLVATGLRDELPPVPGVAERWGKDVLHCPFCHGYEVRDQPLGVLGGEVRELTLHQALMLPQWSADVVLFPNRIDLTADERERVLARGVRIVDGEVARLVVHRDRLAGVELADGQVVPRAAVFVGPRFVPQDQLLVDLGCQRGEGGGVVADSMGGTSVSGVWAAGNVVDPRAQVITAAGEGSAAALAISAFLLEQEVARAVDDARRPLGVPPG